MMDRATTVGGSHGLLRVVPQVLSAKFGMASW
jgi:hypothetical protein